MNARRISLISLLMAGAMLAACFAGHLRWHPIGVSVASLDVAGSTMTVGLRLRNPNRKALPIHGVSFELMLGQETVAHMDYPIEDVIPALGTDVIEVETTLSPPVPGSLRALAAGQVDQLDYRLRGQVHSSLGEGDLPFVFRGLLTATPGRPGSLRAP